MGLTVQEVSRDIEQKIGCFPNISQIARYLGKKREYAAKLMNGCEYLADGRSKKYFHRDVARRIVQEMHS